MFVSGIPFQPSRKVVSKSKVFLSGASFRYPAFLEKITLGLPGTDTLAYYAFYIHKLRP
jgi:hypothetical protein